MRAPAFWHRPVGWQARLLAPLGWLYGQITLARMAGAGKIAPAPVLCVGNLTAGGAGKTPTVLALLARCEAKGLRAVVLSRGYGGREAGPLVVDPAVHTPRDVGDEPLLMAMAGHRVIVSRDRAAGAALAISADLIIMDDGFQNPEVIKDASLLVVDGGAGIGNGKVLPAGPLRAPLAAQLPFAQSLLVIGDGAAGEAVAREGREAGLVIGQAMLVPVAADVDALRGRRLFAFAGIGRPEKFFDTLRQAGLDVAEARSFPDHHPYRESDIARLQADADRLGLTLVTTAKDHVRLPGGLAGRANVVSVTLSGADHVLDAAIARAMELGSARG
jgi:tetraacyldisaccharide 4'-kinase